jgi:hypothetical protein
MSPVLIHLMSAIFVSSSFIVIGLLAPNTKLYNLWPGLSLLAFGGMVFLFAYSAIYKSISLRLLVDGAQAYPDAVSIMRLQNETVLPRFIDRINLLEGSNHFQKVDDLIVITSRGRKLYSVLVTCRTLLGFAQSGLYYTAKKANKC